MCVEPCQFFGATFCQHSGKLIHRFSDVLQKKANQPFAAFLVWSGATVRTLHLVGLKEFQEHFD